MTTVRPVNWKKNLAVVWLSQFLAMAGFGCCMPFIPLLLKDDLQILDDQVRGVYVSAYYFVGMVSLTVAYVIWGALADRFGRKIMILRASYTAAVFYPLLAFAPNVWVLLLVRFVSAFFSGTVNPAQTLLVTTAPPEKHGYVLGILSTALGSGHLVGYMGGGLIVEAYGYTAAFVTCGVVYFIGGLLVHLFAEEHFVRPDKPKKKARRPPFREIASPGVVWLMALFFLLGISQRITQPFVAMQVEFIMREGRIAFFTGVASAAAAVGGVLAGFLVGRLNERIPPGRLLIPVLALSAVSRLLQAYSIHIWMFVVAAFLMSVLTSMIQPLLQVMLSRITRIERRGAYFGWSASLSSCGGIVCSFISGTIAYFADVRGIFTASAVLLLLMAPMMLPTNRTCRKEELPLP